MLLIAEIELPPKKDPAAFAKFVEEKWVPTVHLGPTRAGQVREVKVLQRVRGTAPFRADDEPSKGGHRFLLLVEWNGAAPSSAGRWIQDETLADAFKRFDATVKDSAGWQEVASAP